MFMLSYPPKLLSEFHKRTRRLSLYLWIRASVPDAHQVSSCSLILSSSSQTTSVSNPSWKSPFRTHSDHNYRSLDTTFLLARVSGRDTWAASTGKLRFKLSRTKETAYALKIGCPRIERPQTRRVCDYGRDFGLQILMVRSAWAIVEAVVSVIRHTKCTA
jgi:hypothetical protein